MVKPHKSSQIHIRIPPLSWQMAPVGPTLGPTMSTPQAHWLQWVWPDGCELASCGAGKLDDFFGEMRLFEGTNLVDS